MNGKNKNCKIVIYIGETFTDRLIYSEILQLLQKLKLAGIDLVSVNFYTCMLSPCYETIHNLLTKLGLNSQLIKKPSRTVTGDVVHPELKSHHLELMIDCTILVISKDFLYDVYLDSLVKSFKPVVITFSKEDKLLNNKQMIEIKSQLFGGIV